MAKYTLLDDEPAAQLVPKAGKYVLLDDTPATPKPDDTYGMNIGGGLKDMGNLVAGAVRGAGSIGATLMYPVDKITDLVKGDRGPSLSGLVTGQQPISRNEERRQEMTNALETMGADPNSWMFKGGKLGAEVAGTMGAGGAVANGAKAIPVLARLAPAIESGGLSLGNAATGSKLVNALLRAGGGAINGGVSAGLVDPEYAGKGAAIGAVAPGAVIAAGKAGNYVGELLDSASKKLMQSALKPTIKQLKSGDADVAVDTLLSEGLNATKGGVEALRGRIDAVNDQIANLIKNSPASVSKQRIMDALRGTKDKFATQVSPAQDMAAIDSVRSGFFNHPMLPKDAIPVQLAQQLKQGTYSVLSKKYGQMGSAETEAQKALARGLKEEIASAVPEVAGLNSMESALIKTLGVTERRALMDANKNPMGLAALAHNPATWAAFMADKSALFKSLAARLANHASQAASGTQQALPNLVQKTGLISAAPVLATAP